MLLTTLVLALAFAPMRVSASAGGFTTSTAPTAKRPRRKVPETQKECLASGGDWGKFGLGVRDRCNSRTKDAGKECADSSQCESACITVDYIPPEKFHKRGECAGPAYKGRACESIKDCGSKEEVCVIIFDPIPGKGRCYGWTITAGTCLNYVKNGRISSPLCVD